MYEGRQGEGGKGEGGGRGCEMQGGGEPDDCNLISLFMDGRDKESVNN